MDDEATALFCVLKEPCGTLGYVPLQWMQQFDSQCRTNHCGQTVARLHQRGGMSAREILAAATGQRFSAVEKMDEATAWRQVKELAHLAFPGWTF